MVHCVTVCEFQQKWFITDLSMPAFTSITVLVFYSFIYKFAAWEMID